jgi:hypothetical protein
MNQHLIAVPSNKFDGFGWSDPHQAEAHRILLAAVQDEVGHRGSLSCSETFACFVEHRIAQALRERDA